MQSGWDAPETPQLTSHAHSIPWQSRPPPYGGGYGSGFVAAEVTRRRCVCGHDSIRASPAVRRGLRFSGEIRRDKIRQLKGSTPRLFVRISNLASPYFALFLVKNI